VGAGRHRLAFVYEPMSVKIGLASTILGLFACCVLAFRPRRLVDSGQGA
jgi:hypothetical protein